jgi:hypothetical protein
MVSHLKLLCSKDLSSTYACKHCFGASKLVTLTCFHGHGEEVMHWLLWISSTVANNRDLQWWEELTIHQLNGTIVLMWCGWRGFRSKAADHPSKFSMPKQLRNRFKPWGPDEGIYLNCGTCYVVCSNWSSCQMSCDQQQFSLCLKLVDT